jgi:hypothetical protein
VVLAELVFWVAEGRDLVEDAVDFFDLGVVEVEPAVAFGAGSSFRFPSTGTAMSRAQSTAARAPADARVEGSWKTGFIESL